MEHLMIECRNCGEEIALPADAVLVVCKKCSAQYKITWKDGVLSAKRILGDSRFTADISRVQDAEQQSALVTDLQRETYRTEKNFQDTMEALPTIGCLIIVLMFVFGGLAFRDLDKAVAILSIPFFAILIIGGIIVDAKRKNLEKERKRRDDAIDRIRDR